MKYGRECSNPITPDRISSREISKEIFLISYIDIILATVRLNVKLSINEIIELHIIKSIKSNTDKNTEKCIYNVK